MVTYEQLRDMLPGARSYTGYVSGLCPFHEDTHPSLLLFEDGFFKCLGCGVVGNYEKLYRKLRGHDASRVVAVEEQFSAPPLPTDLQEQEELVERAHYALTNFEQLRWYLENRGVAGRIETCNLGWYKGWYVIPIYSRYNEYKGMVLRAGTEIQKVSGMRFVQPHGQKAMMYCPDWRLMETAKAIGFVFGLFDALALSDLRFAVATSIGGKDSFDPLWLEPFRKPIVVIPDRGEEDTAMKVAGRLGWRASVLKIPYPPEIKDPAGYLEINQRQALISAVGGALGG
jgi:hypothetical protein